MVPRLATSTTRATPSSSARASGVIGRRAAREHGPRRHRAAATFRGAVATCGPRPRWRSAGPAHRTRPVRSGSPDRPRIAASASIHARSAPRCTCGDVVGIVDPQQHDRQIAGNAQRPERGLRPGARGDLRTRGAQARIARAGSSRPSCWKSSALRRVVMPRWRNCTCACVQASVSARSKADGSRCRSTRSRRRPDVSATIVQKVTRAMPPAGTLTRRRIEKIGSSTVPGRARQRRRRPSRRARGCARAR